MGKKRYCAKEGSRISKEQAQRYGERLEQLARKHGGLTPRQIEFDARRKGSPLHDYFEWDNTIGGYKHRLWEARQLISTIRIITEERLVKAYYNITITVKPDEEGESARKYVPVQWLQESDLWRRALEVIRRQLKGLQDTYRDLKEIDKVLNAIAELETVLAKSA